MKDYNSNTISNPKKYLINNISADFNKTSKILNKKYLGQNNKQINNKYHEANTYLYDKKIFKNTKLYNVVKPKKFIKKRNFSNNAQNHNNLIIPSLTDGNLNNNTKKFLSIFHSNTLKSQNINIKK